MDITTETRLSVRLAGPLAEHVNRQISSALYSSHSEYIRDLVRRDMIAGDDAVRNMTDAQKQAAVFAQMGTDDDLKASMRRGLADVAAGRYHPFDRESFLKDLKDDLEMGIHES